MPQKISEESEKVKSEFDHSKQIARVSPPESSSRVDIISNKWRFSMLDDLVSSSRCSCVAASFVTVVCLSHLSETEKTRIEVEFFFLSCCCRCSAIKSLAIVEITFVFDCLSCGSDTCVNQFFLVIFICCGVLCRRHISKDGKRREIWESKK